MEYQIVEKASFNVLGKSLRVSTKDGENLRRIPEFWGETVRDGTHDRLKALATTGGVTGNVMLGICSDFAADMSEFTYAIAVESTASAAVDDLQESTIPALTWAVFPAKGALPESIQNVWGEIWSDFFPNSGYAHGPGPEVEAYQPGDPMAVDYSFELWIPVVKK